MIRTFVKWGLLAAGSLFVLKKLLPRDTFGAMVSSAEERAFRALVPAHGAAYVEPILAASRKYGVSPFILLGIAWTESDFGRALKPNGTGDFIKRGGFVRDARGNLVQRALPPGGYYDAEGDAVPTSHGWGWGVWQLDWGTHRAFIETGGALDPWKSTDYAVGKVLAPALKQIQVAGFGGDVLLRATVAAYNAGPGAVIRALKAGRDPDTATYGGNYVSKVLGRVASYTAQFDVARQRSA